MNNIFQENKKSFFLLLGLLFLLLIVAYFFFYQPKSQEFKKKEGQVEILENDNQVLQIKISNAEHDSGSEVGIENYLLENKLPLKPEIEELILTLQEIELISDSRFDNISFSYGDTAPQREEEETDIDKEDDSQSEEDTDNETQTDTDTADSETFVENAINFEEIPENLQVITVSFSVTSPDYEHFQQFINLIENQERFMTVTSMDFQKPAEREIVLDEDAETITSDVNVTTFYFVD
jgi:type IV pilus assembly protein PilO